MGEDTAQCQDCSTHFNVSRGGDIQGAACPECGGQRMFMDQPSPTQSDGALRDMVDPLTQVDQGGNPLGEGMITGGEGAMKATQPMGKRDDSFPASGTYGSNLDIRQPSLSGIMADIMWHDASEKTADDTNMWAGGQTTEGPGGQYTQNNRAQMDKGMTPGQWGELGVDAAAMFAAPEAAGLLGVGGEGAAAGGEAAVDATEGGAESAGNPVVNAIKNKALQKVSPTGLAGNAITDAAKGGVEGGIHDLMHNVMSPNAAGGAAPAGPSIPAPGTINPLQVGASTKTGMIPMLLADLQTSDSIPSLDTMEAPDQKEFNSGDMSPSNMENPNLEASGMNGEDDARSDSAFQTGFAPNSPGIERAKMIEPLLRHYYESDESGERDPIVRALHETLEGENPGYLQQKGMPYQYEQPSARGVHAGVNMMPGPAPIPGSMAPEPVQPNSQPQASTCPNCGAQTGPDGSCPLCGGQGQGQGMPQAPAPMPGMAQGMNPMAAIAEHLSNHQGPVTPEQIAEVQELLVGWAHTHPGEPSRAAEAPNVPLHPEEYAKEMAEVTGSPNVAPQIDPSQLNQTPPPAMPQAPGGMPAIDPSQAGGGAQPMQPMSAWEHTADANTMVPRCPRCGSASTTVDVGGSAQNLLGGSCYGRCHGCDNIWEIGGRIASVASVVIGDMAEMPNPHMQPQHHIKWADTSGRDLIEGQTYELHSANYPVPDTVKVMSVKPDGVELQLEGGIPSIHPDITVSRTEATSGKYEFVHIAQPNLEGETDLIPGTSPDQVPPVETTDTHDEITQNVPHTQSSANPDMCKCGSTMVDHQRSTPTSTFHSCVRCGSNWETQEEDYGYEGGAPLQWLFESSSEDDFTSDRSLAMAHGSGTSRDLSSIAAKDERLQEISQRLNMNKQAGKHFSPSEKRALIDEKGAARNLEMLSLDNTHYAELGNEDNVNDAHIFMGM